MTSSKVLFFLCLFFIAGIFIESAIRISQIFIWVFLLLGVLFIIFSLIIRENSLKIRDNSWILGFCILFFTLGILRCQIAEFNIKNDKLSRLNDRPEEVVLYGIVSAEPDNRDTVQRLKIKINDFNSVILITKNRYPEYNYLDKIKIIGKLKTPSQTEEFSYKNYLLKDKIYSVMDFPKIEPASFMVAPRSFIEAGYKKVLFLKQKLRESIRKNYLPPESFILEGTILGDSSALTQELKNKLNTTGLRHIIAVSGTHIVILSSILMSFLLAIGLWRGQAFYLAIIFLWLYILLTGLPASGIRAGIMATLFLLAQKIGRQSHIERIIVIAGAVMLFLNPLLLFYDVGFQLSFLAVMGLIFLDPFIKSFLFKIAIKKESENKNLKNFLGMVSATLSAQIFTLPIMLYSFGNVSLIAPITNILILPVVSFLMIFGFLSSIIGIFSNFLGFIFSVPCYFLLVYFIKILDIFSAPIFIKTFENVHWFWLVFLYLIIIIFVAWIKKLERNQKFY